MNKLNKKLFEIISSNKKTILFIFTSLLILPIFQSSIIYLLYLMIEPARQSQLLEIISSANFQVSLLNDINENNLLLISFFLAIFLLISQSIIKYKSDVSLLSLTYKIYLEDSFKLLNSYLYSNYHLIRSLANERITSSIRYDCGSIVSVLRDYIIIFGAVSMITMYLIVSISISMNMTVLAIIIAIMPLIINRKFYNSLKESGKLKVASNERIIGFFEDFLSGIHRVKTDFLENAFLHYANPVLKKSQEWRILRRKTTSKIEIITSNIMLGTVLSILYVGVTVFSLKLSSLMILLVIFNQMRSSVNIIALHYGRVKEKIPSVDRFFEIMDLLETNDNHELNKNNINFPLKSKISANKINFKYDDKKIINDLDFSAKSGDRILIQGPSGEGKSTFLALLTGLMPPESGEIKYDNSKMNSKLFTILRNETFVVSPETYLFNLTIKENLVMDKPIEDNKLHYAISHACLDNVISKLPKLIDSKIGINGNSLSLGQRQRLVLARLFLRDPNFIFLDEPTANLDEKLETKILKNVFSHIRKDSILIIVAHKKPKGIDFNKHYTINKGELHKLF